MIVGQKKNLTINLAPLSFQTSEDKRLIRIAHVTMTLFTLGIEMRLERSDHKSALNANVNNPRTRPHSSHQTRCLCPKQECNRKICR